MDGRWLQKQFDLHPDKTRAALARYLDLDPPAISKILGGRRQIKAQEYMKMRAFFGMPTDGRRAVAGSGGGVVVEPLASGKADGLSDNEDSSDGNWIMPANLLAGKTKSPPEKIKVYSVNEKAMMPDFLPDEQVLVDLSDTVPSPAGVFIVSDGIGYILRQCEYIAHSSPRKVRVSALSPQIKDYEIELDKAALIGRVIAKLEWI